ncbi:succinate dehydrogenase assembly factor 2 [Phaeovulum sp.]|uniref:succinate dehydrogenase assembly factor 2 n=1 Tax=Phaeovulum sp. TaxID=2934796 RepID=UPI0035616059
MSEAHEARLKRMAMRSWRRGIKEMDLIFGPWADANLASLDAASLDLFDALLAENDQDIYPWITTATVTPPRYAAMIDEIRAFALERIEAR